MLRAAQFTETRNAAVRAFESGGSLHVVADTKITKDRQDILATKLTFLVHLINKPSCLGEVKFGFEALRALHKDAAGLADGVFNTNDLAYAQLKIWRDLNQDGISQSNELLGLAESGITAINLTQSATQIAQGKSSFTRTITSTDGSVDANGNPETTSTEQCAKRQFHAEQLQPGIYR